MASAVNKILTGVKKIVFTPWNDGDTALETSKAQNLLSVIGDTVAISQDDPETSEIPCETRDEPIIESVTLGKYNVTMDSADIAYDLLVNCAGFTKSADNKACFAPSSYVKKYVQVEVFMQEAVFVLPRILLTSKIDASSLKTGVAKGTFSGTAYTANVKVGNNDAVNTPFFLKDAENGEASVAHTVAPQTED